MIHRSIKKFLVALLIVLAAALALGAVYLAFFVRNPEPPERYTYGVTFSKMFAQKMGLDWRQAYLAILDELKPQALRLIAYWPEIEPEDNSFAFDDLDWQIREAAARDISVMLSVGQKLPRWPECHYPTWLRTSEEREERKPLTPEEQSQLLAYIEEVIAHYKNESAITSWQVENEPFLDFGICPPLDKKFFDKEVALVRNLDPSRKLVISESGEFSTWVGAARRADVVGTTLYRVVWSEAVGYFHYPIPERFYWKKTSLIKKLFSVEDVVIIELQAEPWAHLQLYENTVEEMMKSMPPEQFLENLRYAHTSRFATMYLWGAEWWFWMKTTKQTPFYWDTVRELFGGDKKKTENSENSVRTEKQ